MHLTAPATGAVIVIKALCSRVDHLHGCKCIEWVGWQVQLVQAGWDYRVLPSIPIEDSWFGRVRMDCNELGLQRRYG